MGNATTERPKLANTEALKSLPVEETKINWELVEKIKLAKLKNQTNGAFGKI